MPRSFKRWYFEPHALDQMRTRGIGDSQVKETVLRADRAHLQGKGIHGGVKWTFKKDFEGFGLLEVVAEFAHDTCYIVTAYWIER
jgi:hypothetical protein